MRGAKVAVTGSIASGKSTLCCFLQKLGAAVASADQIVHQLLLHDPNVHQSIELIFGPEVFVQGRPSRERISREVFQKEERWRALEALLHPLVRQELGRIASEKTQEGSLFIAEVPLLFEAGMEKDFDLTVAVVAPRILSSLEKQGDLQERAMRQLSPKEKAKRSSIVLLNWGSLNDLEQEAALLFKILRELFPHEPRTR